MSDEPAASLHGVADAGVAGKHPPASDPFFLVGPATADQFNTARLRLVPIACWRVDDIRFQFASSFVTPEIKAELRILEDLIKAHPGAPLSIFGHADPVGDDDSNKTLSGRRATAIYALLTRNTAQWEELFSQPQKNDNWDKNGAIETMLAEVSPESANDPKAADKFRHDAGARKGLFSQYMDKLCGPVLKLAKTDFLGRGANSAGKADFQGCSEFNPLLIFSVEKEAEFDRDKDKTERNSENAPNRRVMVLLFRSGSQVDPARWPCPTVKEGIAGCQKRFWSDGEKRRSTHLSGEDRKFEITHDIFACRFYQRLTAASPCERALKSFRVRLYDGFGTAIPFAPFSAAVGSRDFSAVDRADPKGFIALRDIEAPANVTIRWGFPPKDGQEPALLFTRQVFLGLDDDPSAESATKKLNNLGYDDADNETNVLGFQLDYGHLAKPALKPTGVLDDATLQLLNRIYKDSLNDLRDDR
jgi:hypothetical protein